MKLLQYRAFITTIIILAGYMLLVRITPIRPRGDGMRAVFLVLSGWAIFAYWRPVRRAFTMQGAIPGELLYAIMVFCFAAGANLNAAMGLFWRLSGQPAHLINNAFFDFWVMLGIVALGISVTVPNLFGKGVPPIDRLRLGAVWAIMFSLVTWLVVSRPDLSWLADLVKPLTYSGYDYDPD